MSLHAQSPERPRSVGATMRPSQPPATLAVRALLGLAATVAVALIVLAGGYGYHRDELYFLEAGRHLAWAYADQGPLTPLLAHLMETLSPGSLTVLRADVCTSCKCVSRESSVCSEADCSPTVVRTLSRTRSRSLISPEIALIWSGCE